MIHYYKKALAYLFIALSVLSIESCRKKYIATAEDMTKHGWVLYEAKDYINSNSWFRDATIKDSEWQDAYNGLGWSYAQLAGATAQHTLLDSGIDNFVSGFKKPRDEWSEVECPSKKAGKVPCVQADILAGLMFSYHAKGKDSKVIEYGSVFLDSTLLDENGLKVSGWEFSHDTLLNYLDVRITMAASYFAEGKFDSSVIQVSVILDSLKSSEAAVTDTTLAGRKKIAEQITSLQEYLRSRAK
tara:strand:- start:2903 stop:3631 length:729 start_codon:yes stop_codon:yes gene_type:complete